MTRRWLFWVLGAAVLALVAASIALQLQRTRAPSGAKKHLEMTTLVKLAFAGSELGGAVAESYEAPLMEAFDRGVADGSRHARARALRRKAIWCGFRERPCAEAALTALSDIPAYDRVPAPEDEVPLLREVLLGPITPARAAEIQPRLAQLRLGFFDHLLRERFYRNSGDAAAADAALAAARRSSMITMGALFAFMALLVGGAVAWLTLLFLPVRKRVSSRIAEGLRERGEGFPGESNRHLATVVVFFAASLAIPEIVAAAGAQKTRAPADRALWTLALELGLLTLVLVAHKLFRSRTELTLGFSRVSPWRALGVGAFSYLLVWPIVVVVLLPLSSLFEKLGLPDQTHPIVDQLQAAGNDLGTFALWLVIAAILAPLLEEAVFRGSLHAALRGRLGGKVALGGASILFAIIHPQIGIGLVGVLLLGLALGLVRIHEKSLWPAVALHAVNNGMALLMVAALFSE